MKYLEVVNLDKYQHYQTGRETIWIKFYSKSLNDPRFCKLRDSERWLFVGLIVIAVETSNSIPYGSARDVLWLYKRLCYGSPRGSTRVAIGLKNMLKIGLIRTKNAITERKVERKKEASFQNQPMIKKFGKWYVIEKDRGEVIFAGSEEQIVYK